MNTKYNKGKNFSTIWHSANFQQKLNVRNHKIFTMIFASESDPIPTAISPTIMFSGWIRVYVVNDFFLVVNFTVAKWASAFIAAYRDEPPVDDTYLCRIFKTYDIVIMWHFAFLFSYFIFNIQNFRSGWSVMTMVLQWADHALLKVQTI